MSLLDGHEMPYDLTPGGQPMPPRPAEETSEPGDLYRRIRSLQATTGPLGLAVAAMAAHKTGSVDPVRLRNDFMRLREAQVGLELAVDRLGRTVDDVLGD